jgi:hypothetical protein
LGSREPVGLPEPANRVPQSQPRHGGYRSRCWGPGCSCSIVLPWGLGLVRRPRVTPAFGQALVIAEPFFDSHDPPARERMQQAELPVVAVFEIASQVGGDALTAQGIGCRRVLARMGGHFRDAMALVGAFDI